jgi:hypothetical protein
MKSDTCENCGDREEKLYRVYRIYETIELNQFDPNFSQVLSQTVEPESEMWCLACMSLYPNVVADDQNQQ